MALPLPSTAARLSCHDEKQSPGLRVLRETTDENQHHEGVPAVFESGLPSWRHRVETRRTQRFRYHPGMSKLLLNLRGVPDDEADDVRRFLAASGIGYHETQPSIWGISGGIWIHDADVAEAKRLMGEYQRERAARARAERAEAERNGTAETFAAVLRTKPLRVVLTVIGMLLMLALMAVPVLLLFK